MKLTQCQKVIRHIEDFGSISAFEAFTDYGIMHLASRITDLRAQGYPITSQTHRGLNRYGEPVHYSVYFFERSTPNVP